MFGDGGEGFLEKNSTGIMAKYCQRCNQHLDLHGFRRVIGATGGSIRSCPETALADVAERQRFAATHSSEETTPLPQRSPDPREWMQYTPAPCETAPYGSDRSAIPEDPYRRVRRMGERTPGNHLDGSSCTVVNDKDANNFIPVHIAGRGVAAPQNHLHGASALSDFNELDAWKRPGSKVHPSQVSSMSGGGLVPRAQ
jgi:hypothetical protein